MDKFENMTNQMFDEAEIRNNAITWNRAYKVGQKDAINKILGIIDETIESQNQAASKCLESGLEFNADVYVSQRDGASMARRNIMLWCKEVIENEL